VNLHARASTAFSIVFVAIGIALLLRTASLGGGTVGYLLGALFVVAGAARLAVSRRMR
jgi:hypothetical protein